METHKFVKGSCNQMCPDGEVSMRTKERILHFFEQHPPPSKENRSHRNVVCISEFSRSAAGMRAPRSVDLRTTTALHRTVEYLLDRILLDTRKPFWFVYEFIFDRLRCVRQEIVIQNLDPPNTIRLLEPIVMFLAYSSYKLCEVPIGHFDPYVCNQHLQECLKKLLCSYDEVQRNDGPTDGDRLLANRPTLEAIYLALNLGCVDAIARGIGLPPDTQCQHDGLVRMCRRMSQFYYAGHFHRVLHQLHRLPPIVAGVAALRMQTMRRQVLISFSAAYHSKQLTVPIDWLSQVLSYQTSSQLINDLRHYKCAVSEDRTCVTFNKNQFDFTANEIKARREPIINELFADDSILVDMLLLQC